MVIQTELLATRSLVVDFSKQGVNINTSLISLKQITTELTNTGLINQIPDLCTNKTFPPMLYLVVLPSKE